MIPIRSRRGPGRSSSWPASTPLAPLPGPPFLRPLPVRAQSAPAAAATPAPVSGIAPALLLAGAWLALVPVLGWLAWRLAGGVTGRVGTITEAALAGGPANLAP